MMNARGVSTKGKGPVKVSPAPTWTTNRGKGPKGPNNAGKKGTGTATPSHVQVDIEDRDPRHINSHLKVHFEDVLGERGVRSPDCLWRTSWRCFTCWKNCLYKLSSLLCGVCLAVFYGCSFPVMAFPCVWICTPFSVACRMFSHQCGRMYRTCCLCFIGAWAESIGQVFWAFNPRYKKSAILPSNKKNVKFEPIVTTKKVAKKINQKGPPNVKNVKPLNRKL